VPTNKRSMRSCNQLDLISELPLLKTRPAAPARRRREQLIGRGARWGARSGGWRCPMRIGVRDKPTAPLNARRARHLLRLTTPHDASRGHAATLMAQVREGNPPRWIAALPPVTNWVVAFHIRGHPPAKPERSEKGRHHHTRCCSARVSRAPMQQEAVVHSWFAQCAAPILPRQLILRESK